MMWQVARPLVAAAGAVHGPSSGRCRTAMIADRRASDRLVCRPGLMDVVTRACMVQQGPLAVLAWPGPTAARPDPTAALASHKTEGSLLSWHCLALAVLRPACSSHTCNGCHGGWPMQLLTTTSHAEAHVVHLGVPRLTHDSHTQAIHRHSAVPSWLPSAALL